MKRTTPLLGFFETIENHYVIGFALDSREPTRPAVLEILVDGRPIAVGLADRTREDWATQNPAWRCHGFRIPLPSLSSESPVQVSVRFANTNQELQGSPKSYSPPPLGTPRCYGLVEKVQGLVIEGFAVDIAHPQHPLEVVAVADGKILAWTKANLPRPDLGDQGIGDGRNGFSLRLPLVLADGRRHLVSILCDGVEELTGSPTEVLVHAAGLAGMLLDFWRDLGEVAPLAWATRFSAACELVSRLEKETPRDVPFTDWDAYRTLFVEPFRNALPDKMFRRVGPPVVFIFAGPRLETTLQSLTAQTAPAEEIFILCDTATATFQTDFPLLPRISPKDLPPLLQYLAARPSTVFVFIEAGVQPHPNALAHLCGVVEKGNCIVYADHEECCPDSSNLYPILKPAWDYDLFLSTPYWGGMWAADSALFCHPTPGTTPRDLPFLALEHCPSDRIFHIPLPLFIGLESKASHPPSSRDQAIQRHLDRVRPGAVLVRENATAFPRVDWPINAPLPRLSLLIPTRDHPQLLRSCLDSLRIILGGMPADIFILDNDSQDPATLRLLEQYSSLAGIRVIRIPGPFNFSKIINSVAFRVSCGILGIINDDIVFPKDLVTTWFPHLLGFFSRADIDVVGVKLLYEDGLVQHGGIVSGINGLTEHAFRHLNATEPGYMGLAQATRACSAVTGACFFTRAELFQRLGGFDEDRFPVTFNDIDYCFRVTALGGKCLVTPHSWAWHMESASLNKQDSSRIASRFRREADFFKQKWGNILKDDPYYHALLNRNALPFTGLGLPTRCPR